MAGSRIGVGLVLLLGVFAGTSAAQEASLDSVGGRFFVAYTDLDGVGREAEVYPLDRIDPRAGVVLRVREGGIEYRYALENRAGPRSTTGLLSLAVPCAEPAPGFTNPGGWRGYTFRRNEMQYCGFMGGAATLTPGDSAMFRMLTPAYPSIATGRFFGEADVVLWPSGEGTVPPAAYAIVDSLQGFETGGVGVPVVAPLRAPEAMDEPAEVFDALASDLANACNIGWVGGPETSEGLADIIAVAKTAWEHQDEPEARRQLFTLIARLAQSRPPLQLNPQAASLFAINTLRLLEVLSPSSGRLPRR